MDIAQPAGVDAVKLVVMIIQAAQTVRHNKKTCQQLVNRAQMIGDLLEKLQGSEKMQQPELRSPLKVLEGILGEAYTLVKSCQNSSYVYQFLMGRKQSDQFLLVQNKIDLYLLLFPLISHIETAAQLDQILNAVRPQAAEVVPRLLSGCSNYGATRCSSRDARKIDEACRLSLARCIQIALLCIEEDAANRPTMQEVVLMLSCQSVALPTPQRPAYLSAEMAKPTI